MIPSDQLCPNFHSNNTCYNPSGGGYPGFERRIMQDTVTLPSTASDWKFSWYNCCRNTQINNISNPSGASIYVECMINSAYRFNDNSPRYLVDPIPYLCVNSPQQFLNGPYDPDNDSMVTINQAVNVNSSGCGSTLTPTTYQTGYQACNPIVNGGTCAGYTVNAQTGTASFTPNQVGKFVIGFKTDEYDRYSQVHLGYIMRDVQVVVLTCNSAPPTIDNLPINVVGGSLDTTSGNVIRVCPGANVHFTFHATSQSLSNTIYISSNNAYVAPGSVLTVTNQGAAFPNATFSWTPTGADIGDHTLIFVAKDSTCNNNQPIVSKSYLVVLIKVLPGISAGPTGHYCGPGSLPWQIHVTGPPNSPYFWSIVPGGTPIPGTSFLDSATNSPTLAITSATPKAAPFVTTSYIVATTNTSAACKTRDTITVRVSPSITISAGPGKTICANTSTVLNPAITQANAQLYWTPTDSINNNTLFNPTVDPQVSTTYFLHVTDTAGCHYLDSTRITINGAAPILNSFAARDTVCPQGTTQLFANIALQPCGVSQSTCSGTPVQKFVGTDVASASASSPYNWVNYYGGNRVQILYRKEDLLAAGMRGGQISALAFNVASKGTQLGDTFSNFSIKIACTNLGQLNGMDFNPISNYFQVYTNPAQQSVTGWNNYPFQNAYYWDGNSNLVVEVCWSKVTYGSYARHYRPGICNIYIIPQRSLYQLLLRHLPSNGQWLQH